VVQRLRRRLGQGQQLEGAGRGQRPMRAADARRRYARAQRLQRRRQTNERNTWRRLGYGVSRAPMGPGERGVRGMERRRLGGQRRGPYGARGTMRGREYPGGAIGQYLRRRAREGGRAVPGLRGERRSGYGAGQQIGPMRRRGMGGQMRRQGRAESRPGRREQYAPNQVDRLREMRRARLRELLQEREGRLRLQNRQRRGRRNVPDQE
jgi:hypothetical protein